MATDGRPASRLPSLGSRGEGWVVGQGLLIALEGLVSIPALTRLPPASFGGWLSIGVGLMIAAIGAWLALRGLGDLGANLTAFPAPRPAARLVDTGVYSRVRHPIYAGVIAVAIGWALLVVSPLALLVAVSLAVWLDLKSRREEVWLVAQHPRYAAYRDRTRRFVPNVY